MPDLAAVLIRTPLHGDVVIAFHSDSYAAAAREWPGAAIISSKAALDLGLLADEPAGLALTLKCLRATPGAVLVGVRPLVEAVKAAA